MNNLKILITKKKKYMEFCKKNLKKQTLSIFKENEGKGMAIFLLGFTLFILGSFYLDDEKIIPAITICTIGIVGMYIGIKREG